jgi:hypothetical protein
MIKTKILNQKERVRVDGYDPVCPMPRPRLSGRKIPRPAEQPIRLCYQISTNQLPSIHPSVHSFIVYIRFTPVCIAMFGSISRQCDYLSAQIDIQLGFSFWHTQDGFPCAAPGPQLLTL